jgi:hypothetical protein
MKPACTLLILCPMVLFSPQASAEELSQRLAEMLEKAPKVNLVAPDLDKGNWCKSGKPILAKPIRKADMMGVFSGKDETIQGRPESAGQAEENPGGQAA